eukprot:scaffold7390_cov420-Prasinococcus_capsulatus_cf.AAC.12
MRLCSVRANDLRPSFQRTCEQRYPCRAIKPLKYSMHWASESHAGSLSTTASMSARNASGT